MGADAAPGTIDCWTPSFPPGMPENPNLLFPASIFCSPFSSSTATSGRRIRHVTNGNARIFSNQNRPHCKIDRDPRDPCVP
ncbi:hypothetical protein LMH87_005485 [Akanthomyces muscarius]|uniref:Uncharacterized protein n=1 Tax=Akanthomyces muscarius TaxID=2231603 RepID=A0A9W8UPB8_AKAMU|nr:hypothetical protein LMH87_005485 [Akanthomyces muscarius]KAJ4163777.1 hypothetical protein LMH87_005485 [Akanthomyces muscarius]